MKEEVSLRQTAYMYILITISPIVRQIPNALASEAGRSGYLSPLWSVVGIVLISAVVIAILKGFPGLSFYEIMKTTMGKFISKTFILLYLIWIIFLISTKINTYALTLQFTLMPRTKSSFFMVIMGALIFFSLSKGIRTIFRFSEFILGPIIVLFISLFAFSLTKIRADYLIPISTDNLPSTIMASRNVLAVGGYIIIALFFSDKYGIVVSKKQVRKLWVAIISFILISFLVTIVTYGVTGSDLTADLPFPFYITVKSISLFNILERFEVLITLVCIISDFISIAIYAVMAIRCFIWLFDLNENTFLYVPLTFILYYLTFYISSTQFESDFFYSYVIVNSNLIFQFVFPLIIGVMALIRGKAIRKQY